MKNTFYLLHNSIQSTEIRLQFFNNIIITFKHLIKNYIYVLSFSYPLIIFYSFYTSLSSLINIYTAIALSSIVAFVFIILVSIPSYYFIKGENLFDFEKIIEELKKVKPRKKKYEKLDENQVEKLDNLFGKEANNFFNTAEYSFETFKSLINNILEDDFENKIYLNEEVSVKEFVSFIDELILITRFDYVDLCKIFQFYKKGKYLDLNYGTVKVELSNFRKLTKKIINQ
ncbi:hypothetical protein NZD85_05605 [Empedobacter stercoris]|nr:hypothetical protein [Empedobacter stercoris]UWX68076.1 hypothetical protein NZD85_05605 [Empedobacter stercoris]